MSWLKLWVFAGLCLPAGWLLVQASFGLLGSKPLTDAIHQSGDWAVRFLLLSLLITPLRTIAAWPRLINVRRMLGLAALAYVVLHLALYIALEAFDLGKVAREVALRFYLTIGFVALLGLAALGATSTDGMVRRLGAMRWNQLHATVYVLTLLSLLHFTLQRKLEVSEPIMMTGFFLWLMGYRALKKRGMATGVISLVVLSIAAGLSTAGIEAGWYGLRTGVAADRVLYANFDFSYEIRPAWWVLVAGLALAVVATLRVGALPKRDRASENDSATASAST